MRRLISLAFAVSLLLSFGGVASADPDCRGGNHFTGNSSPPPQHDANICIK